MKSFSFVQLRSMNTFWAFLFTLILLSLGTSWLQTSLLDACNSPINTFERTYCGTENKYFETGKPHFWVYDLTLQPAAALIKVLHPAFGTAQDVYVETVHVFKPRFQWFTALSFPWIGLEVDSFVANETKFGMATLGRFIVWSLYVIWWALLAYLVAIAWEGKRLWMRRAVVIFFLLKSLNIVGFFLFGFLASFFW